MEVVLNVEGELLSIIKFDYPTRMNPTQEHQFRISWVFISMHIRWIRRIKNHPYASEITEVLIRNWDPAF